MYRDRRYDISRRKNGPGACFDLKPPIPLDADASSSESHQYSSGFKAAQVLSEYWMYFLVVVFISAALGVSRKRRREADADELHSYVDRNDEQPADD